MIKKTLPIVVGLVLFALILRKVDLPKTWALLKTADPWLCLAAFGALVLMVYLKGLRWSCLLSMQGHRYRVLDCFLIYMGSLFWGNVTPGRAGDFMKVLYLKEDLGLTLGTGMASVLVDRVFDLYLLLILGSLGLLAYPGAMGLSPQVVRLIWIFFGALVAASLAAFNRRVGEVLIRAAFRRLLGPRLKDRADQAFRDFHAGMEAFYSPKILVPGLLSLVSYLLFFTGSSWMAQALGLSVNFFYLAFCLSVVNIVSLLTLLGMGTREGTLILLFGFIGLSQAQALAYSLLIFFVGTVLFTLLCLGCYLLKPIRLKTPA